MKRINDEEKIKLGHLIEYYRNQYFHSNNSDAVLYKQVNFCKGVCSQTQLSRLENGEPVKDSMIYEQLLTKLNLEYEKVSQKDWIVFETYFNNILSFQNNDNLIINYHEYVGLINGFQNQFKQNILYTHYNYALEFIINLINEDFEEASYLLEDVEGTLDILPDTFLILALQYLGKYYFIKNDFNTANKYYLLTIEHMHKSEIINPIVYVDIAYNYVKLNKCIYSISYLEKALDSFDNTENYHILASIYKCYGTIYLKHNYLEDAVNFLRKSLEFSKYSNRFFPIMEVHELIAIAYYFSGNCIKAYEYLKELNGINTPESSFLIENIFEQHVHKVMRYTKFKTKIYQDIQYMYKADEFDENFTMIIEKEINKLNDPLVILIFHDLYSYLKGNKKYKKALEVCEILSE